MICFTGEHLARLARARWVAEFRRRAVRSGDQLCVPLRQYRELLGHPPLQRGLGDRVHRVAHPIARWIDRRFGTKLANCRGCARRRRWLNRGGASRR